MEKNKNLIGPKNFGIKKNKNCLAKKKKKKKRANY